MAKKKLKQYKGEAIIFYSQEAAAGYTIMAESDEAALAIMREIVSGPQITAKSDYFDSVDKWFNVRGTFKLVRGDEVPLDDDDEAIIGGLQEFENSR
jgi:hypothetical protein